MLKKSFVLEIDLCTDNFLSGKPAGRLLKVTKKPAPDQSFICPVNSGRVVGATQVALSLLLPSFCLLKLYIYFDGIPV